jgi:hypothetical protein
LTKLKLRQRAGLTPPSPFWRVIIFEKGDRSYRARMKKDEYRTMCTSPQIPLREKLFFRMIYETTTRPGEVLEARIELWNRTTGEITLPIPKSKYNRWTRRHIPGAPKTIKLTGNTSEMLTGKRLTLRHFEKMIDKWARLLNIQRRQSIKPSGREYHLITLMGLKGGRREAP